MTTADMGVAKARLRPPAVAIIVNAGIALALCLFNLLRLEDVPIYYESQRLIIRAVQTLDILSIPALAFCIYSALQMMNARRYGFAITSAIITILSGFFALIGFPIGIWALIVLLKRETKSVFTC